jgi:site-specific recombinase XerD
MESSAAVTAVEAPPVISRPAVRRKRRDVPKVKVYSRHMRLCKLTKDTKTACNCPKSLVFWRDSKLHRVSAETNDRRAAEQKARELENNFAAAAKGEPTTSPIKSESFMICDLVDVFVAKKKGDTNNRGKLLKESTVRQWKFELTNFAQFLQRRGLINIGDVRPDDVQAWRDALEGEPAGRRKRVLFIVAFFQYCVDFNKLAKSPAIKSQLKVKRSATQEPKALDNAQFTKLLAALPLLNGRTTDEDRAKLKSLAILMRMTGLALKDGVCCKRDVFEQMPNGKFRMYLRRAKTGKAVNNYLSAETMAAVLKGANASGKYLFISALPTDEKELKNLVEWFGGRFAKLSELAAVTDENGEKIKAGSHSFGRHSFVLMCLNADMPTHDIATLIGDTPSVVEQHYSTWIASRAARLEQRMMSVIDSNPCRW